jgi:hypothetical protein
MSVYDIAVSQLRVDVLVSAPTHEDARKVITALTTCEEHRGAHHFAVVGEGMAIGMTRWAKQCLIDQGVLS